MAEAAPNPPKVYNRARGSVPRGAVPVDRSTPFGNPFCIGPDGTRAEVVAKYEFWIFQPEQKELRELMMAVLRGKDLVCWCKPQECHADLVLKIANAPYPKLRSVK